MSIALPPSLLPLTSSLPPHHVHSMLYECSMSQRDHHQVEKTLVERSNKDLKLATRCLWSIQLKSTLQVVQELGRELVITHIDLMCMCVGVGGGKGEWKYILVQYTKS